MTYSDPERQRQYSREWVRERRKAFFEGKSCVRCGSQTNLELDHIDRLLKVSHAIWSWARDRQEEELKKCQILCHNCHLGKTHVDLNHFRHGTNSNYDRGCRCSECKMAKSIKNKKRLR